MKGLGLCSRAFLVFALALCPETAVADASPTAVTTAIPTVAMLLALTVAVFACISFRRRALAVEANSLHLEDRAALQKAVAELNCEQVIFWPFVDDEEIVSAGLPAVLNIDAPPGGWYDAFRSTLAEPDRAAIEQAVTALCEN